MSDLPAKQSAFSKIRNSVLSVGLRNRFTRNIMANTAPRLFGYYLTDYVLSKDNQYLDGTMDFLSSMKERDAEWYYLCGVVSLRRGLYNDAYSFFKTATNKDPLNMEYREAFARMDRQAGAYRQAGPNMQQMDCCTCCNNLLIADCCCECMGGDIIPCC